MNNDKTDFQKLTSLTNLFQRIKQLSWVADRTTKRYPGLDLISEGDVTKLKRDLLALGFDIEAIYQDWKKIYDAEPKTANSGR